MNVQTYLYFEGNCRDAIEQYLRVFGASVELLSTYEQGSAASMPEGWGDKVFHATLRFGDSTINMGDVLRRHPIKVGGFALLVHVDTGAEAELLFASLGEGGVVLMPMQSTMWASHYGIVTDRFGITWKVQA